MKKILLLILAILMAGLLQAQLSTKTQKPGLSLGFNAGPSVPVGDFSSANTDNENAGFSKTGYYVAVDFGYTLPAGAGMNMTAFYNRFPTKDLTFIIDVGDGTTNVDMTLDDWQMFALAAGPSYEFPVAKDMTSTIRVMGGATHVRLPSFYYNNEEVTKYDWGWGALIMGGADLKLNTSNQFFIQFKADFMYARPVFHMLDIWTDETDKVYQEIFAVQLGAGIGFRF